MFVYLCVYVLTGFTEIMPWQGIPLEEALPVCERGDSFTVDEIKLLEKQTCPPDYLTEAELITLMEKHGIGEGGLYLHAVIYQMVRYWSCPKH